MNPEVKQIAQDLRNTIHKAREYSQVRNPHDLFIDCESIIGMLSYLITPKVELETEYRQQIVTYIEAGDSNAKAEAKARAGESYKNWKKLEGLYTLGEEQVRLLKKFKDNIEAEYGRA